MTSSTTLPDPSAAPAACKPVRVLVVDDDALSRNFLTHLLALLGHEAQAQGDSGQALVQAQSGAFDVLLLDLGMPGLDGFEVLRRLRAHEAHARQRPLAVVAVTGYASEADRMRCLAAGFNDHLAKPIQAASLAGTLERVLGAPGQAAAETSDVERLRASVRRLQDARAEGGGFAPTVTESFALRSAQLLETLRRCVQQRDAQPLPRAAEALKASAEYLGAMRLAGMCTALQEAAARADWLGAEATLGSMNNEHQVVLTLLFESSRR
ncbi:MAG: response regulator [Burkholderiaceae bacterium]|nr:response regulator [Burkholderiaceae bacterium]